MTRAKIIRKTRYFTLLVLVAFLATLFICNMGGLSYGEQSIQKENIRNDHIKIIDLSLPLEPQAVYENISCRPSATIFIETTLCVHDLEKDRWVSESIWNDGVWERPIISK